jgi:hypothetical protein
VSNPACKLEHTFCRGLPSRLERPGMTRQSEKALLNTERDQERQTLSILRWCRVIRRSGTTRRLPIIQINAPIPALEIGLSLTRREADVSGRLRFVGARYSRYFCAHSGAEIPRIEVHPK